MNGSADDPTEVVRVYLLRRAEHGTLNRAALAETLGVSRSAVSMWLNAQRGLPTHQFSAIAKFLGLASSFELIEVAQQETQRAADSSSGNNILD